MGVCPGHSNCGCSYLEPPSHPHVASTWPPAPADREPGRPGAGSHMGTSSLNAIIITQGSPTQPAGRMKDPVGRRASPQPAHQQSTALRVGQADPQTIEGVGNSHRGFSFLFRKTRTLGSFSLPPLMVGRGSQPHPSWLSGPLGPHQDWNPGGLWSAAQSCGPAMVSVSASQHQGLFQ